MKRNVLIGIIIVVVVIVAFLAFGLKGGSSPSISAPDPKCGTIDISKGSELITGKSKSLICLSDSVKECTSSRSIIVGNETTKELEGTFSVDNTGSTCDLTFEMENSTISCNYKKEQLQIEYDSISADIGQENATYVYGLSMIVAMNLQVRLSLFAQHFAEASAPSGVEYVNMTFTDPASGDVEEIPCTFSPK
ncbi:hypothetical protein KW787_01060 [Candidatus Pacearchaeota archaeon]|nr:hypothetical protein [Candidatus Pacearchaeota archaeon]